MSPNPTTLDSPVMLSSEELRALCSREAALLPTAAQWQAHFRATLGEAWFSEFKRVHPKSVLIENPRRRFVVKVEAL